MATVTRYVNTDAAPGGDGTTRNLTSGDNTHAYDSLANCESSEQTARGDLVTNTDTLIIKCAGGADTDPADFRTGWTTNSTYYVQIEGDDVETDGRNETGVYSTSYYRLTSGSGENMIETAEFTKVYWLQFDLSVQADNMTGVKIQENYVEVGWCIFKGNDLFNWWENGVWLQDNAAGGPEDCYIHDCYFDEIGATSSSFAGIKVNIASSTDHLFVYGCTFRDSYRGIYNLFGTVVVKNCIGDDTATATSIFENDAADSSWDANSTNNIADDGSQPAFNTNKTGSATWDAANSCVLGASDTVAKEYGADLSSDSDLHSNHTESTTDILGVARTSSWDCGAHELSSGGGGPTGIVVLRRRREGC